MDDLRTQNMTTVVIARVDVAWANTLWAVAYQDAEYVIEEMRDWCIINLDVDTWGKTRTRQDTLSQVIEVFTFDCPEDATAFKIRFGIV